LSDRRTVMFAAVNIAVNSVASSNSEARASSPPRFRSAAFQPELGLVCLLQRQSEFGGKF
jgi:hypothetical protein